jgi:hypothetical protein
MRDSVTSPTILDTYCNDSLDVRCQMRVGRERHPRVQSQHRALLRGPDIGGGLQQDEGEGDAGVRVERGLLPASAPLRLDGVARGDPGKAEGGSLRSSRVRGRFEADVHSRWGERPPTVRGNARAYKVYMAVDGNKAFSDCSSWGREGGAIPYAERVIAEGHVTGSRWITTESGGLGACSYSVSPLPFMNDGRKRVDCSDAVLSFDFVSPSS